EVRAQTHPQKDVVIGSLDPLSGYFQQVTITTTGAAVSQIELNDPRYRNLDDPKQPLSLSKPVEGDDQTYRTFATTFPEIDGLLKSRGVSLDTVDWKVT